ncbi:MAG: tRNA (adenosine(37)-N6)-threonylcarbamoyltransferase complex ATPase subunit type 1 TsaE [Clostridiales bacterium]|jgi:tRNA threonylcarbamoyladenosine biosynthesis protein TsaE|nr:tRNA (adenosine(37)-N6)-threonylcarbamoyltransferase complex ATPase subunit type 1 TsaE [Clostridiales bacterium]
MQKVTSFSPNETENFARLLGEKLKGKEVVALFGELGMGKTTFVRGLARGLCIDVNEISSPTFSLVHEHSGKIPLYHFDMYRIETYYDLCSTGFFDFLELKGVLCTEWSENIENVLPKDTIRITIERGKSEHERILTIVGDEYYENSWS